VTRKALPTFLLATLLCHVLSACSGGSEAKLNQNHGDPIGNEISSEGNPAPSPTRNRQGGEDGREVMVPDPTVVMVPDQPEVMREDMPTAPTSSGDATLVPSDIDVSTCETLFFADDSGGVTFYRCFTSYYPVLSTKGICVDDAGVKMDHCPNDTTPACRTTSDPQVLSCEELGKQWCVNTVSNASQVCPAP